MADPVELMLGDLADKYAKEPASDAFLRLYTDDERFGRVFASLHERLNDHFVAINDRARSTRHYWADNSRALIALIDELAETIGPLCRIGFDVSFHADYDAAVRRCKPWLSTSGGSTVPEDFEPIEIVKYEPVFIRSETTVKLKKLSAAVKLQLIGEGSYGNGSDTIYLGPGNDTSSGETLLGSLLSFDNGNDTIYGGPGNDTINGQNGNDTLTDTSGTDTLSGGNGDDTINVQDGVGGDTANGDNGTDTCTADTGDTTTSC